MIWRAMMVSWLVFCVGTRVRADEGYWLLTDPPVAAISAKYHFIPDVRWLSHLQSSVVKIGGGTGSFVSANGLVMTNRHVGEGELHTLSTSQHDYETDGFYAWTREEELPCQGMELRVLERTRDVTARVQAAIKPGAGPDEAEAQQKAIEAEIEKEAFDHTGLTSEIVTLFGGARYDLYQYKKYPDVRLVFAPDRQAATFGGDADNFEFPRYDLDVCFFRVYDHGKPLATANYLKWSRTGPGKEKLVFVAGHPGYSQRLATMDEIEFQRDVRLPASVNELDRMERELRLFSSTGREHAREAAEALASVANARKAYHGFLDGLRDADLLQAKVAEETRFRTWLEQHPEQHAVKEAYAQIAEAVRADRANFRAYQAYERFASRSDLFNLARTLVRAAEERRKPNGERLPAYRDNSLPALEFRLFSGRPSYPDLEQFFLAHGLENLVTQFGMEDPLVKKILAGKSPHSRAKELVSESILGNVRVRKQLYTGGKQAIQVCHDPIIALAMLIDPSARAARKIDDENEVVKNRAYAKIYREKAVLGIAPLYPDATGTLRLAYGTVSGYAEAGKFVEPMTDFAGFFSRAEKQGNRSPFNVPEGWQEARSKLNLATPLNFATTADILGGNSGSPVVDQSGNWVGIIFDGNAQSLSGRYAYEATMNRSVAVSSLAVVEALRKIYLADRLVDELRAGQ